jgi:poly(hydroxyalkanoate) depolymerase family esterase
MPEEKPSRSAAMAPPISSDHPRIVSPASEALAKRNVARPTGAFETRSFANSAGKRDYKLYIPEDCAAQPGAQTPLIVMLHGCTQSPDDFAVGTRMNQIADKHGFLVAYPAQAARANGSKCWNWFVPNDQRRGHGEPSLIAGITREVMSTYRIDPAQVFVAGLSAGGAMAVVLGETYPELYAAVGVHSGLPFGAAHDVPSAFQVMADARARSSTQLEPLPSSAQRSHTGTPTIIFHGDADSTVAMENGLAIAADAVHTLAVGRETNAVTRTGWSRSGQSYTQIAHVDTKGRPLVETWILHRAGHAWSGGSDAGSFTQPEGVDASEEMVRFFHAQARE